MKTLIEKLRKPYIKRATSDTSDTPGVHPGKGRAARTVALPDNSAVELSCRRIKFNPITTADAPTRK
jgi:hypothetical protein